MLLLSAGASAALGGVLAGVGVVATGTALAMAGIAAPVAVVLVVGFIAFYLASTIVDSTLGSEVVKAKVGGVAR